MGRIVYHVEKSTGLVPAQKTTHAMQTLNVRSNDITLWGVSVWTTKVIPDGDGDVVIEVFDRNAPVAASFTAYGLVAAIKIPMQTMRAQNNGATLMHVGGKAVGDLNAAGSPAMFPIIYRDADAAHRINYVLYNPKSTAETFGVQWEFSEKAEN